jgi:outer membrane lipoprotein
MKKIFYVLIGIVFIASCAPVVSEELRSEASNVPFKEVIRDPERYRGMIFIWGGTIVQVKQTSNNGSLLEVVQNPLDRRDRVENTDITYGRFLAQSETLLDPLVYRTGRIVTVAGELVEARTGRIGESEYLYPVLRAREVHLLREGGGLRVVPSFFLGIGIGD